MAEQRYTVDPAVKVLLSDLGVNHANVLRRAGLPTDLLARTSVSLTSAEYFGFWGALEEEHGDHTLPLRIAEALTVEVFDPPIFAALCSPDLNHAARRIQTYKPLIGPLRLDVDVGDAGTTIACRWGEGPTPPQGLVLTELLFWVALARIATRHDVRPTAVVTTDPPTDQGAYVDALGVPIERGAIHAVTFGPEDAARPFLTADDAMWEFFEPELRLRLSEVEVGASTEERVRAVLAELLPAGQASMRDVGHALAMSTRTLQRRLNEERTSFQAVLASTRESLARHYLTSADISAAEISFLLGYADPSSFYRAFRDWTGHTPERVRAGAA